MNGSPARAWVKWYTSTALILLNTFLLFVVLNLLFALFPHWTLKTTGARLVYNAYPKELIAKTYPDLSAGEITTLLDETWSRGRVYEPYTGFKEAPFSGTYINVSEHGYRLTNGVDVWPPDPQYYTIFVFGGSTTFGYGVTDAQTIPTYLENILNKSHPTKPVRVYNFGRGDYYSTQERVLFEQLIENGIRPDQAVFIDGLNDFNVRDDTPQYAGDLTLLMGKDPMTILKYAADLLPLKRFLSFSFIDALKQQPATSTADAQGESFATASVDRYLTNKRLIEASAKAVSVPVLFVWQPVPLYHFDITKDEFARYNGFGRLAIATDGYAQMEDAFASGAFDTRDFVWCADVGEKVTGMGYVDLVHYDPEQARYVAECIAPRLER